MERLIGPLQYLRVIHPAKVFIDLAAPLLFATIVFILRFISSDTTGLLINNGLLSLLIPLLGALSGFYIAALTAVSAFPIPSLDRSMPGDKILIMGRVNTTNPTRRKFLSMMFGYLAFVSIALFLLCLFSIYLRIPIGYISSWEIGSFSIGILIKWFSLYIILFCVFNLISVTLLALYYLSDRIHHEENALEGGPKPRVRPLE